VSQHLGKHPNWGAALFTALLATCFATSAQQPIPPLAGHVTDTTGTLDDAERTAIEQRLVAFEARKGAQIAVLIVTTTAPESIEEYALRAAETWQIGRAGVDDGVVLVVALNDRRLRFEVGYGLEGAVPDAIARRIIAETIAPRFYENDYAGGLEAGLDALISIIDGEPLPAPVAQQPSFDAWTALPFVLVVAALVAPLFQRALGALPGAALLGAGAAFVVWLLSSLLLAAAVTGFMVFIFTIAGIGRGGRWSSGMPRGFGGSRGGGFGGGGGFRGGGGRFGGGGASGGW
jgi:uncharacterized protein